MTMTTWTTLQALPDHRVFTLAALLRLTGLPVQEILAMTGQDLTRRVLSFKAGQGRRSILRRVEAFLGDQDPSEPAFKSRKRDQDGNIQSLQVRSVHRLVYEALQTSPRALRLAYWSRKLSPGAAWRTICGLFQVPKESDATEPVKTPPAKSQAVTESEDSGVFKARKVVEDADSWVFKALDEEKRLRGT